MRQTGWMLAVAAMLMVGCSENEEKEISSGPYHRVTENEETGEIRVRAPYTRVDVRVPDDDDYDDDRMAREAARGDIDADDDRRLRELNDDLDDDDMDDDDDDDDRDD